MSLKSGSFNIEQFLSYKAKCNTVSNSENKRRTFGRWMADIDKIFPVLDPYGLPYAIWRLLMTLVILFFLFEIPLLLGFTQDFHQAMTSHLGTKIIYSIGQVFLIADIIIEMNLGYYHHGQFIDSRIQIIKRYLRFGMYVDIYCVIIIPFSFMHYNLIVNILSILFILKVARLSSYDKQYLYLLSTRRFWKTCYKFTRLIIILLFYSHVLACIFFFIDYTLYLQNYKDYVENEYLWLMNAQCMPNIIGQYGWSGRYLYALYWSIGTVSTVGYGDIFPMNPYENLFQLIVIINICVLFGYFVNNVFLILGEYHTIKDNLRSVMFVANSYFNQMKVSHTLRYKIRRFLEFRLLEQGDRNRDDEQQILSKFSTAAYKNICLEQYKGFLLGMPLKLCERQKLNIAAKIKQVVHFQEEIVCSDTTCCYYLQKGKLLEFYECGREITPTKILRTAALIKLYEFFTNISSNKIYRSKRYSELLEFQRSDLYEQFDDQTKQSYFLVREALLISGNLRKIGIKCDVCLGMHMEAECPKLHFTRKKIYCWNDAGWEPDRKDFRRRNYKRTKDIGIPVRPKEYMHFEDEVKNYLYFNPKFNLGPSVYTLLGRSNF